jgi:glycosyltransferase involved in cell wall biosynthesis
MHMLIAGTSYFPQYTAGTEVYMKLLTAYLQKSGDRASVACGGDCTTPLPPSRKWGIEKLTFEGVDVFRVVRDPAKAKITDHYGRVDAERHATWIEIFADVKPDVVMVVGRGPAIMGDLEVIAKANGVPVIWTLIHPDQLCPKGPRINSQGTGCMEAVKQSECSDCIVRSHGAPAAVSAISRLLKPLQVDRFLGENRVSTCLKIPHLVDAYLDRWRDIRESVSLYIAHSEAARQLLLVNGIGEGEIMFSVPGFEAAESTTRFDVPTRLPGETVRFGFVGRLCQQKGVDTLVESWRQVDSSLNCSLQFWGDPKFGDATTVAAIQRIAAEDARVVVQGGFARGQLPEVYSSIDVLIVPSEWFDNCPFVISEAFMFGIPVIGADFGGISTMIQDGGNGWLFPMKDACALARIIEELAKSPDRIQKAASNVCMPRPFADHAKEIMVAASKMIAHGTA